MSERVTYTITVTPITGRYRAQIYVDGLPTEKAFFSSRKDAEQWAAGKVAELREIVRG